MRDAGGHLLARSGEAPLPPFSELDGFADLQLGTPAVPWRSFSQWDAAHSRQVMVLVKVQEREDLATDVAVQLTEPAFQDVKYRQEHFDEIQALVECFFLVHPSEQMYREGQAAGLPIGVLNAPEDLFRDEHLTARGFFVEVEHEGLGKVLYPGAMYRFSSFGEVPRRRAPKLGEHTETLLAEISDAIPRHSVEDVA